MQPLKLPKYHLLGVEGRVDGFGQWLVDGNPIERVETAAVLSVALTGARQRYPKKHIRVSHMSISPHFAVCMLLDGTLVRGHMRRKSYGFTARAMIDGRNWYLRVMGDWPPGQPHVLVCNGGQVL